MTIHSTGKKAYTVVVAPAEVDIASSNALRDDLERAIQGGNPWVIADLSNVEFIDSTGLGAILAAHHLAEQYGGTLVVVGPAERTQKLLTITQIDRVLDIYPTVEDVPEP
ncbi:MAG TPA: STAS domain-containing protein [Nocardioidaceae bacterium]|nr:STAS domain-containing protein [Nocardioidaceae bacterium]